MSQITASVNPNIVHLSLNAETTITLCLREAWGLMLMAAGVDWSTTKLTQFNIHLDEPYVTKSLDGSWPLQHTRMCNVFGNGSVSAEKPHEELRFVFGPLVKQCHTVSRVGVLRALNDFFVGRYGETVKLKDSYGPEDYDKSGDTLNTGVEGMKLSCKSYINFVKKINGTTRDITNLQWFTGNQNCRRPDDVEKYCFVTDVYTGGFYGNEAKDAIEITIGSPRESLLSES